MSKIVVMHPKNVNVILDELHALNLHKEELLIELITYQGHAYKTLKDLKKSDIKDVKCTEYLNGFKDDELVFNYTNQHINLLLRRLQKQFDVLDKFDNFSIHFFRKTYGYFLYLNYRHQENYSQLEAIDKVGAKLGHFHRHRTFEYLNIEPDNTYKGKLNILKGPSDEETIEALKEIGNRRR